MLIPTESRIRETVTTELVGNRFQLGYTYQFTELFGLNLSYGHWDATHTVTNSKVKTGPSPLTLFSSFSGGSAPGSSVNSAFLSFLMSGSHTLGPIRQSETFDRKSQSPQRFAIKRVVYFSRKC